MNKIFENNRNMDLALKSQIINAINKVYLVGKYNRYIGFLGTTAKDFIQHLLARYSKILHSNLVYYKQKVDEPMDTNLSIDVYFKQIGECIQFAADANTVFSTQQILQIAYYAISSAGLYMDACKEWRQKDQDEHRWKNFKSCFAMEYQDLQELNKIFAKATKYHTANPG